MKPGPATSILLTYPGGSASRPTIASATARGFWPSFGASVRARFVA